MTDPPIQTAAFYLPQFHPIPENDEWWEPGYTEWAAVTRAKPQFRGHEQPHLPRDLGFYDLRLAETRQAQADLARQYGIDAFCYYHYWFSGRRILERPFQEVLDSGQPDFPFLLCWANEAWSRRWDGRDDDVLLAQTYSDDDDRAHARWLCRAWADPRYVRVEGKPAFLVYRPDHLPDARRTVDTLRKEASRAGVGDLYLCGIRNSRGAPLETSELGFDATVEFQPFGGRLGLPLPKHRRLRRALKYWRSHPYTRNDIRSYDEMVRQSLAQEPPAMPFHRCVTPSWDNAARRVDGGARILLGGNPETFERWLNGIVERLRPIDRPLLFINAWNEWAEGNHLEPCQRYGRAYLEAVERVLRRDAGRVT